MAAQRRNERGISSRESPYQPASTCILPRFGKFVKLTIQFPSAGAPTVTAAKAAIQPSAMPTLAALAVGMFAAASRRTGGCL